MASQTYAWWSLGLPYTRNVHSFTTGLESYDAGGYREVVGLKD